ncbi:zinc transporter ZIP3-like [Macrosteles quadrilineatus]|uniref:zinc transporter ZIP3-like n=1 Tax=Macrosteles quadrilineatus TaxID=74068 RepID=UPI0023E0CAC4|nr:zinc transporter ZIP3-like [Macrosteles quadrilineatus]XP_054264638.1 zinc transporter ZIP3-like [Macrosteles quadrilineatus]
MGTDYNTDITVAKVTSMVVLGGAAFIVTLIPVFISKRITTTPQAPKKSNNSNFILSLCQAFGGGVLLCTTFLHLLPEVSESIETLQENGGIPKNFPLPLPELVMCCGFFTMYIVEEVVHKLLHSRNVKNSLRKKNPLSVSSAVLVDADLSMTDSLKIFDQNSLKVTFAPPCEEDVNIVTVTQKNYSTCGNPSQHCHNHQHLFHEDDRDSHVDHDHQPHSHDHTIVTEDLPSLRELLIVLALTVHEGFEGLAIGLEDSVAAVWYLMTAVAVHKCVIAFCIGVELVSGKVSVALSVFYAFVYSCASPFGIGIGLALSASNDSNFTALMSVLLQGMATGTLLYVVFFEILKRDTNGRGLSQMVVVILGFVAMAVLAILINA